jgi:hypothetical protein
MKKVYVATCLLTLLAITNLSHASIVNINSRSSTPVEIFLNAGTYVVEPIGISEGGSYDAWTPWGGTNCTDPAGCIRTSPTTNTGWMADYYAGSPDITSVSVEGVNLTPVSTPTLGWEDYFLVTPSSTYYRVTNPLVYPDALTALSHAQTSTFTLSNSGVVNFFLRDSLRSDNRGGMSLSVNAVPIPPSVWLFGSGLLGLIGIARRKKAA